MPARIRTARRRPTPLLPLLGLGALTLSACSVGPDYQPSTPSAFNDLRSTDRTASRALAAQPDPKWWRTFNDAQLDSLIDRAIASNLSLQQAVLRIADAREQTLQAGAADR